MTNKDKADEMKEAVEEAVENSDEIDGKEVTVGKPMSVKEFGEMMKEMSEKRVKCPLCDMETKTRKDIEKHMIGCPNDNCQVGLYYAGDKGGVMDESNVSSY